MNAEWRSLSCSMNQLPFYRMPGLRLADCFNGIIFLNPQRSPIGAVDSLACMYEWFVDYMPCLSNNVISMVLILEICRHIVLGLGDVCPMFFFRVILTHPWFIVCDNAVKKQAAWIIRMMRLVSVSLCGTTLSLSWILMDTSLSNCLLIVFNSSVVILRDIWGSCATSSRFFATMSDFKRNFN